MKAQIKFIRIDEDSSLVEPEVVFEIIPNMENGVTTKNRWLIKVPYKAITKKTKAEEDNIEIRELIGVAKELIKYTIGL